MEKAQEGLQQVVGSRCLEFVSAVQGFACAGILNYAPQKKEEVRRALKSCINQLELQKSLFRPVSFSVAAWKWQKCAGGAGCLDERGAGAD